jgi:hypothetical protein
MAYLSMGMGVVEAEDEYAKQLATYKRRGCEAPGLTRSKQRSCDSDYALVLLFAERNELHSAGVRGISLDEVKRQLAAGKTMIAGFPQGMILNLLGAAKAKVMVATRKHSPNAAAAAQVPQAVRDHRLATLADKIEKLELSKAVSEEREQEEWVNQMDTRLREAARGKGRARAQTVVTPLALLAAGAIVLTGIYTLRSR